MTTSTRKCPHGNDFYSGCGRCESDHRAFIKAEEAYKGVSHALNGGNASVVAAVFRAEHKYLLDKLAGTIALAIVETTYEGRCTDNTVFVNSDPHPAHDGRLSCGTVVGAMRMLSIRSSDEPLEAVAFWKGRAYEPLG